LWEIKVRRTPQAVSPVQHPTRSAALGKLVLEAGLQELKAEGDRDIRGNQGYQGERGVPGVGEQSVTFGGFKVQDGNGGKHREHVREKQLYRCRELLALVDARDVGFVVILQAQDLA
jgi:hypothetical protein